MVSRLRPVEVDVSFLDRTYVLGDNIDLTIELTSRRDCQVREARVDLVLEESWTERQSRTIEVPIRVAGRGCISQGNVGSQTKTVDKFIDHKENVAAQHHHVPEGPEPDVGKIDQPRTQATHRGKAPTARKALCLVYEDQDDVVAPNGGRRAGRSRREATHQDRYIDSSGRAFITTTFG